LLIAAWIAVTADLGAASADTATPGPRIALVIGNSDYGGDLGILPNPVNDARLVAKTLKGIGFDVIEVEDADQNAMKRAIADFGDKVAEAGTDATGLFFYAGHGLQVGGQNYLIPIHANISRERDVDIEAVSMDTVLKQMAFADSKVNIVILDACRNNPLSRGFRSTTKGLAEITVKPQGSFISYSTAPGDVAADGNGGNSPYSTALADALSKPGLDINDVFRKVRAGVMEATHGKQVPWDSSSLTAPYYFVASAPMPAAAAPVTSPMTTTGAVDPKTIELTFWEAIKDSKSADDFQAYLAKYPDGDFAGLAKIRIKQFGAEAAAPAVAPRVPIATDNQAPASAGDIELTFWNSVKDANAKEDLEAYLKKYPAGHFSELARTRIASLDQTRSPSPPVAAAAPVSPAPPQIQEMDATFVARQSANVRAEPGTDAKVIARFKEDDAVAVTGKVEGKDWYRVKAEAGTGYVSAGLVKPSDADEIADWRAAKKSATVDAVQLFLKQHPGSGFDNKAQKLLATLLQTPPKPAQPALATATQQIAPAPVTPSPAQTAPPTPAPTTTSQASLAPAPASAAPEGLRVGDTYEMQGRATIGFSGGWWGNTHVVLTIERANGDGAFEGKLTGSGELNFWEECDITVEGDKVTIRGTTSSVDNKPDVLRLKRSGPDHYDGRAQSGAYMGTASMVLKSRA
jgi:carboxyl-terminal processing protease